MLKHRVLLGTAVDHTGRRCHAPGSIESPGHLFEECDSLATKGIEQFGLAYPEWAGVSPSQLAGFSHSRVVRDLMAYTPLH